MMNKSIMIVAIASAVAAGLGASTVLVAAESGETSPETVKKPSVPRYSEICAHGHNGFPCDEPQYKKDIKGLQERVGVLEQLASRP